MMSITTTTATTVTASVVPTTASGTTSVVTTAASGTASTITTSQFDALMGAISAISASKSTLERSLEEKFEEFKQEVKLSQAESVERAAKKARTEKPQVFRFKGNEDQFYFNEKLKEAMDDSAAELVKATSDPAISSSPKLSGVLEGAKKAVEEGMKLLTQRQKHIRLADRSEQGWKMVHEYEMDDLATDSGDEKRIAKAEKAAESKAATAKKKTQRMSKGPLSRNVSTPVSYSRPTWQPPQRSNFRVNPGNSFGYPHVRPDGPIGPCHACHEYGHLRKYCPKYKSQQYPFDVKVRVIECESVMSDESVSVNDQTNLQSEDGELAPRIWEVEHACVSVKGRLKDNFNFWANELQATRPVLDIVQHGYYLPLLKIPDSYSSPNHKSAILNESFVDEAITELLSTQCIRFVSSRPHISSPLLVVESSSGKKRLVINLKYLNLFLWKDKFKYEDLRSAMMYFRKGNYLCTFDLKSGYHHVDIHMDSQTYLGFEWRDRYYVFTVLPFGLATACYVFTKLLRPVVKYLRARGTKIVMYIDDGIAVGSDYDHTSKLCQLIKSTLVSAGFVLNTDKSKLYPSQCVKWLGFEIDLEKGCIAVPQDKIVKLKAYLANALASKELPARTIASITGRIISLGLAIGPLARLRTRALYAVLDSRRSWLDVLTLSEEARDEVVFWFSSLEHYDRQPIWRAPSAMRIVYSDASDSGFGGYTVEHGGHIVHGQWTEQESKESSTWRELRAVAEILKSVAPKLSNLHLRWFTDNQGVVRIIQVGSKKGKLQSEALKIFKLCLEYSIKLEPEWIPREENEVADYISRIVDYDDWGINHDVFNMLDDRWGPHTVDRFASHYNTKLVRFNSRYLDHGTEAVDAFTVDWGSENNYFCPPVYLVPRVLYHAQACKCIGTLVIPEWPSAIFWPLLHGDGMFKDVVVDSMYLPLYSDLIVSGKRGANLFKNGVPNTNVLALRLDFSL